MGLPALSSLDLGSYSLTLSRLTARRPSMVVRRPVVTYFVPLSIQHWALEEGVHPSCIHFLLYICGPMGWYRSRRMQFCWGRRCLVDGDIPFLPTLPTSTRWPVDFHSSATSGWSSGASCYGGISFQQWPKNRNVQQRLRTASSSKRLAISTYPLNAI